jgi:hypothetical protein
MMCDGGFADPVGFAHPAGIGGAPYKRQTTLSRLEENRHGRAAKADRDATRGTVPG